MSESPRQRVAETVIKGESQRERVSGVVTDELLPAPVARVRRKSAPGQVEETTIIDPLTDTLVAAPVINRKAVTSGVEIREIPQPLSDKPLLVARQGDASSLCR